MADTLGLYVSIPFCRSKCTFCNFGSGVYPASHHGRYVERVCEEVRNAQSQANASGLALPQTVDSIYLGGGTPSVLAPELLKALFTTIRSQFNLTTDAEITMECAPGQIDDDVIEAMVECGVNRVSLGVQSFIDREAATTGRLHNRATTLRDLSRLRAAGINRRNLDLIAGLPHQTLASWRESLAVLTGTGVEHASIYMLEVDDDSRLGKEMLDGGGRYHAGAVPKDDTIAAMFEEAADWLASRSLAQYELSNFAVSAQESKHNLKYWQRAPYLGIGLDAHSMLRGKGTARFSYGDDLDDFLTNRHPWEPEILTRRAELEEAWFLGLRLSHGVQLRELRKTFSDQEVEPFLAAIRSLSNEALIDIDSDRIALTPRGKLLSNEVFRMILEVGDEVFCQPV